MLKKNNKNNNKGYFKYTTTRTTFALYARGKKKHTKKQKNLQKIEISLQHGKISARAGKNASNFSKYDQILKCFFIKMFKYPLVPVYNL